MTRDKAAIRAHLTQSAGIAFNEDFHALSSTQTQALGDAARSSGYRKPPTASGSTARYFFAYLCRGKQ